MRIALLPTLAALTMAAPALFAAQAPKPTTAAKTPLDSQMEKIWASGKYVILFVRDATALENEKIGARLASLMPKLSARAELVNIDFADDKHRKFAQAWHVHAAPLVLTVAPGGTVTGFFRYPKHLEGLDKAIVPPDVVSIIQALQNQQIVFLVVNPPNTTDGPSGRNARKIGDMLRKSIAVVEVDAGNKDTATLLDMIGYKPGNNPATVFVISPSGGVTDKLQGDVSTKSLLEAFQTLLVGKSGCGSMGRGPRATCE